MIIKIKYWYRRLTNKCILCGKYRLNPHYSYGSYHNRFFCCWCNKITNHGRNYGIDMNRLGWLRRNGFEK